MDSKGTGHCVTEEIVVMEVEGLTLHEGNTMSPWCCPLSMSGRKGHQNDWTQAGEAPEGSAVEGHADQTQSP